MTTNAPVQTVRFEIRNGPDAGRLVDAFKYAFDDGFIVRVMFEGRFDDYYRNTTLRAQVVGLEYESGSKGMFIIKVNIRDYPTLKGYYNANDRTGFLQIKT